MAAGAAIQGADWAGMCSSTEEGTFREATKAFSPTNRGHNQGGRTASTNDPGNVVHCHRHSTDNALAAAEDKEAATTD
ncbi:hypothetical protein AaE_013922 [Aphanomyces astaci]|uniref:Uncharacterized protein n=1 Tax=Aphanomyces astaci TaxID=112090 RepID=A0A6A4Z9V0_APHAT|nr:hypothetical protein AaE_013922 [Aphanomyces astaci]